MREGERERDGVCSRRRQQPEKKKKKKLLPPSFHNFTVRVPHTDPSATRYIVSFRCDGVSVLPDGQRWVRLVVFGQSFILHQIRKMVGTAVAVFRGAAPEDAIASALRREGDVATPMAPELGLFLAETVYSHYNATWAGENGREDDDDDDEDDEDEEEEAEKVRIDAAVANIDPALQEQHRAYLEQQQKQNQKKKRECLSLGLWGDAAEKFKVRERVFFFRNFLFFCETLFFFRSTSPSSFSHSLIAPSSRLKTLLTARVRLSSHRPRRRRAQDQRGVAPVAQRPQLPLLELEQRGKEGPAPWRKREEEGSDGRWGLRERRRRRRRRRREEEQQHQG